ncbi:hypothetical protein TrRE_jg3579 [Triparma retinervis]|uniref:Uncharacterized protein n=1 Tax=Triparma retinervis TaxID=2557542 RepID=A0A9W7ADX4_9STRA|nr:hypothetical protein TrRE_jg3579 [Triparma retinervis]
MLLLGKATVASVADARGERGVEKRRLLAIEYLEKAKIAFQRMSGRDGIKETTYLMAILGVNGAAEEWASL